MPCWVVTFRVFFEVSGPMTNFFETFSAVTGVCLLAVTSFESKSWSKVWLSRAVKTLERMTCGSEGSMVDSTACLFILKAVKEMPFPVKMAAISMDLLLGCAESCNWTVDGFHLVGPIT